jgi:glycosyltransferase involved in cell wall biosynthesis
MKPKKIKIAFILPSLDKQGPIIVAKEIIDNLSKSNFEITVFYFKPSLSPFPLDSMVRIHKTSFFRRLDLSSFNVVHSHCIWGDIFAAMNKPKNGTFVLSTMHNYMVEDLTFRRGKILGKIASIAWKKFLHKHDAIVSLSNDMALYYRSAPFKLNTLYIIPNGRTLTNISQLDPHDQIKIDKFSQKSVVLGMVCGLNKRKGVDTAIRIVSKDLTLSLVVVGDGPEKGNLIALARKLKVTDRCLFLGHKTNPCAYFKSFDLLLLPSRSEGFPLAAIEAASMGVPVVASSLPTLKEAFDCGEVIFAEQDNVESFLKAIKVAYEDRNLLGRKLKQKYLKCFTSSKMAQSYTQLYEYLCESYS